MPGQKARNHHTKKRKRKTTPTRKKSSGGTSALKNQETRGELQQKGKDMTRHNPTDLMEQREENPFYIHLGTRWEV